MLNEIIYYLGLILFLFGLISLFVFLYKIKKNKEEKATNLKELIISSKWYLLIPFLTFLIGFILLNVAFYNNPSTIDYLNKNSIEILWYHQLFVYLFGTIFVISLFSLIYSLFVKLYLDLDKYKISKKKTHWWLALSIIVFIISFFIYGEGNAPYLEYPLANAIYIGAQGIKVVNIYKYGNEYSDGLSIYLYAIFILFGACLVLYVADYKIYKEFGRHDLITNTFLVGFPCGIIGARIWYVILSVSNGETTFTGSNRVNIFDIRDGGLGIMGGAILGIIGGVSQVLIVKYGMKKEEYKNFNLLKAIDIIIPCILFAQAIGRIGNFFNNEVYGGLVSQQGFEFLPSWVKSNMYYQHGTILKCTIDGVTYTGSNALAYYKDNGLFYLPLFFIEFITNLCGYFILEYVFRKGLKKYHSDGSLLGGYLVWYGTTRAILEPLRTSADYFSTSLITSYVMIGGGILLIILAIVNNYVFKRKELLWYAPKTSVLKSKNTAQEELEKIKNSSKSEK